MTRLRQRVIEEMTVRNLAPVTQEIFLESVAHIKPRTMDFGKNATHTGLTKTQRNERCIFGFLIATVTRMWI